MSISAIPHPRRDDACKISDRLDVREHADRNIDIESLLDFHHEIHDLDGIDIELRRDFCFRLQRNVARIMLLQYFTDSSHDSFAIYNSTLRLILHNQRHPKFYSSYV